MNMNAYYPSHPFGGHAEAFRPTSHYSVNHYGLAATNSHLNSISTQHNMCGSAMDDAIGYSYESMVEGVKGFGALHGGLRTGSVGGGVDMDYQLRGTQGAPPQGSGSPTGAPCGLDGSPVGMMHRANGQHNSTG